jgi:putative peptidoglycan lipid II flippase
VGLLLVREPLVRLIYQRGAFEAADAARVAWVLMGYASGVWAYSLMHVLTRGFYARQDASTPLRVSVAAVGLNLSLNLVLIWPMGAAGLAWSTAISATAQAGVLLWLTRRTGVQVVDGEVGRSWGRTAVATGAMAGAVGLWWWAVPPGELGAWGSAGWLLAAVGLGAGTVLGVAWAMGSAELGWLRRRRV